MEKQSAVNSFLGKLICYSCRAHNSFSPYDKVFLLPDECEVRVHSDGRVKFYNPSGKFIELGRKLIREAIELDRSDLKSYGEGYSVSLRNSRLECASCGDEEFLLPVE